MAYFSNQKSRFVGKFCRVLQWKTSVYFTSTWSIFVHLVYFTAIWYIFWPFGTFLVSFTKKNLATPSLPFISIGNRNRQKVLRASKKWIFYRVDTRVCVSASVYRIHMHLPTYTYQYIIIKYIYIGICHPFQIFWHHPFIFVLSFLNQAQSLLMYIS
jgi:hypothetical protein